MVNRLYPYSLGKGWARPVWTGEANGGLALHGNLMAGCTHWTDQYLGLTPCGRLAFSSTREETRRKQRAHETCELACIVKPGRQCQQMRKAVAKDGRTG